MHDSAAGSVDGGERAAAMYPPIGSAKVNDSGPEAYLRHVLEPIAEQPINMVQEVLPWAVANAFRSNERVAA
jgi:hypothetical protein